MLISGLAASGKSTISRRLAEELGLQLYSGGEVLKTIAAAHGFRTTQTHWWETSDGMAFLSLREKDPSIDKACDEWLLSKAREGGVVIDSWVLPWLYSDGLKVWLKASKSVRAERLSRRSGLPLDEAARILELRDRRNIELYARLYGIRVGSDYEPFHLILDTTTLSSNSVYSIVLASVRSFYP